MQIVFIDERGGNPLRWFNSCLIFWKLTSPKMILTNEALSNFFAEEASGILVESGSLKHKFKAGAMIVLSRQDLVPTWMVDFFYLPLCPLSFLILCKEVGKSPHTWRTHRTLPDLQEPKTSYCMNGDSSSVTSIQACIFSTGSSTAVYMTLDLVNITDLGIFLHRTSIFRCAG